jgi:hypothetical protein
MTLALTLAAIRRHPFSFILTVGLASVTAVLLGISVAAALLAWAVTALLSVELWYASEPILLRRFGGCRVPTDGERQRLEAALGRAHLILLVATSGELAAARGLRCLVIGRDLMDLFEDRALDGFLVQVAEPVQAANLAGFVLVWLGNLPLLAAWVVTRVLRELARILAVLVGTSLVVPLVVWRDGFLLWVGRLFVSMSISLLAAMLLSSGLLAAGLLIGVAWLIVPAVGALLALESRRAERSADQATLEAGFGAQLLEAADLLALVEPARAPDSVFRVLCLPGRPIVDRTIWLRRQLHGWATAA